MSALVQKLWNYCNILRDDGLSYGDYVEQLTFLLFLKMADEQSKLPFNKPSPIPSEYSWPALLKRDGDDLEIHYRHTLEELGKRSGMLGVIFDSLAPTRLEATPLRPLIRRSRAAQLARRKTKFRTPAKLRGAHRG
jgi:type I restriction enzyme M protein